jgi:hypothetical protein
MITNRPLELTDLPALQGAMDVNKFHPDQQAESYAGPRMCTKVYEDEKGTIGFLQYTKVLRLRTTWLDNNDHTRNGPSIFQAIADAVELAKKSGFTEILFQTSNPLLARFASDKLGFEESEGEYRLEVEYPKEEAQHV